jgi:hypothetical protein
VATGIPLVLIQAGEPDPERPELGAALLRRAVAWAEEVGDARVISGTPSTAIGDHPGPVLVVAADQPRLSAFHADAALGDLAAGADLSIGPALDGGRYLLAVGSGARSLPDAAWDAAAGMEAVLALAATEGLEVGLLRPERGLRTEDDVRAARVDPLCPREIAALL